MVAGTAGRLDALGAQLARQHKEREAREELNVLYVAATRARHFLHVSGFVAQNKKAWHPFALKAMEALPAAPPLPGTEAGSVCYAVGTPREAPAPPPGPPPAAIDPRLRAPLDGAAAALAPSARAAGGSAFETAEGADRGTALHCLLQRLSEGVADEARLWAEVCARLGGEPPREDFEGWLADARAVVAAPVLAPFFEAARYRRAWNEVPVSAAGATGVIDRLVDDGETLWVLDYKTHSRPQAAELVERYRPQLAAYAAAVGAAWPGRPVRAALVLTATKALAEIV
jgi:ATP-dependent helicase/nuclease subunit A